jgi:hypothetical protein
MTDAFRLVLGGVRWLLRSAFRGLLLLRGLLALLGVLLASMIEADASKVSELSAVLTFVVLRPTAIPCAVLASAASIYVVAGMARCCVSLWLV